MSLLASRNARAFAAAQAAWDNAVPDDYWDDDPEEEATPYCPNCGCDMEWLDAEWRCEACEDGGKTDEPAEPGESHKEMGERK